MSLLRFFFFPFFFKVLQFLLNNAHKLSGLLLNLHFEVSLLGFHFWWPLLHQHSVLLILFLCTTLLLFQPSKPHLCKVTAGPLHHCWALISYICTQMKYKPEKERNLCRAHSFLQGICSHWAMAGIANYLCVCVLYFISHSDHD